MSTCISRYGEWSDHILDDAYTCTRCLVLDEDALVAELRQARARLAEVEAERDAARARLDQADVALTALESQVEAAEAELEAARPVVEAAVAWREQLGGSREVMVFGHLVGAQSKAMIAAVDLYRSATTRNLDSALPDPSLDAETLPTEEKP